MAMQRSGGRQLAVLIAIVYVLHGMGWRTFAPQGKKDAASAAHRYRCFCQNCPGEKWCCCKGAQSPAQAMAFSTICDQPLDGNMGTVVKYPHFPLIPNTSTACATPTEPLRWRSPARRAEGFPLRLERPPQVG